MAGNRPENVELAAAMGFSGQVASGLLAHPNGEDVVYPLGAHVVVKNVRTGKQWFLPAAHKVTCIALSPDGTMLASGHSTYIGFKAPLCLWNFEQAKVDPEHAVVKLADFHNQRVQAVSFSPSGKYLASLGGTDDNRLVIWNAQTGRQVTSTPAARESALTMAFYNGRDDMLVTAGYHHINRWTLNSSLELDFAEANTGSLRRVYRCLCMSADDKHVYVGTTTGDVLLISLEPRIPCFKLAGSELFRKGIRSMAFVQTRKRKAAVVLGTGSGDIITLDATTLKKTDTCTAMGEVTSVAPVRASVQDPVQQVYCGTSESNIYLISELGNSAKTLKLRASCHYHGISDVAFLEDCESLFVTSSTNDIRVWDAKKQQELLRIQVPNIMCNAVALPRSGDLIISGWSDGKIRAFKPVTGALEFVINDAHPEGVTAVAVTNDCQRIISGGERGAVRFWSLGSRKMEASLKEHKSAVTSIAVRSDDKECVTSSMDGSCISWDLEHCRRLQAMFASTNFKSCIYHPDESQILTCGSDRKLTYWDAYDGGAIRIIEAASQVNALAVDKQGDFFACGGNALQLNLFSYDEGELIAVGEGHSGPINAIKISPDQKQIVSVGSEGAIFVWQFPANLDSRNE